MRQHAWMARPAAAGIVFLLSTSTALAQHHGAPPVKEQEQEQKQAHDTTLSASVEHSSPIADAMAAAADDVRTYNHHLVTLAGPYFEGRLPGTRGMELAKDYCEYHLKQYGLEPAFPVEGTPFASYRDPFELAGSWKVEHEALGYIGEHAGGKLEPKTDFMTTGMGKSGEVFGGAVFIGYSIDEGPDGYSSFDAANLAGKVAVMFRFEPMDDEGTSRWGEHGQWSEHSGLRPKITAAVEHGAAAVVIINTPGADDPRVESLGRFSGGRAGRAPVPVVIMTPEAGEKLVASGLGEDGPSLFDLRKHADEGGPVLDLKTIVSIDASARAETIHAENVGGVLRGVGDLADEWIVLGAHLDHLGHGDFGSRRGPGEIHPGADDNASGSSGVLVAAEKIKATYDAMDPDQPRRSILFMLFTGEESGLNGSKHYVDDPIVPLEQHTLMINWDMIGRLENGRAGVAGTGTGEGLADFCQPFFDASPLVVSTPEAMSGASDHASFYQGGIPVLFGMEADVPAEYHTPDDQTWTINRTGAIDMVRMFCELIPAAATRKGGFAYQAVSMASSSPSMGFKVRFGIMPASYAEEDPGVPVGGVSPGSPAEKAGVKRGDRLMRWDGMLITDINEWMSMLAKHNPGDEVKVGVVRDGEEVTLTAILVGKGG